MIKLQTKVCMNNIHYGIYLFISDAKVCNERDTSNGTTSKPDVEKKKEFLENEFITGMLFNSYFYCHNI